MRAILGFLVCAFFLLMAGSEVVGAEEYDWASEVVNVHYTKPVLFQWTPHCPTYYQLQMIHGIAEPTRVCMFGGKSSKMGFSLPDNGKSRLVVSQVYDAKYHIVTGVCETMNNCLYIPETDTLVAKYETPHGDRSVRVFRGVESRLDRGISVGASQYIFDASSPEFSFNNDEGRALPVEAVAASGNGKWIVLEYRNYGVILLDTETFAMRRVYAPGWKYGWSVDPTAELAVSNDGRTIAVMGERVGMVVISVNKTCGDTMHDGMRELFKSGVERCPMVDVDVRSLISQFHGAYDPAFDSGGGRLDFVVLSKSGEAQRVGLRVAMSQPGPVLEYLALGDSFVSGEGEVDSGRYVVGTDDEDEKCHLSRRSYPFVFARLVSLSAVQSVACSGAKMGDIVGTSPYWGQGMRLGGFSQSTRLSKQSEALESFFPGRIPQLAFVERYEPGLVSVGVGGNDAGLMTKLRACAMPGECEWISESGLERTAAEIRSLFGRLVEFYQKLAIASPVSRFLVIGYPQIIDEEGMCDAVTAVLLTKSERRFMNEAVRYLNQVIKQAAGYGGVAFGEIGRVFAGHELCSGSVIGAMNGLRLGDDGVVGGLKLIGNETFHPTPHGHELIAYELRRQYHSLSFGISCGECSTAPSPPEYWGELNQEGISRVGEFATPTNLTPKAPLVQIQLPEKTFLPGSVVRAEVHSEPVELGFLYVDARGAGNGSFALPTVLTEGIHTLHLFGTSYTGEQLELYQEIGYGTISEDQQGARVSFTEENGELSGLDEDRPSINFSLTAWPPAEVLGTTVNPLFPKSKFWWGWLLVLLILLVLALIAYNGCMASIRKVVKTIIPRGVFKKIEPMGHLFEAVLMNIRYGFPARKLRIIGVTGTNGKTTTSFMIHRMLHESGKSVALLTTVANGVGSDIVPQKEHMTTTKTSILLSRLKRYAEAGAEWAVVETSSHALAQNRIWGLPYEVAVMTNITHEHLDYHGTFKNYVEAKRRLFKIANRHGLRFGAVNAQDPSAKKFAKTVANSTTYGIGTGELEARNVKLASDHSTYTAHIDGDSYDIRVNIPGEFNVSNSLAAIAVGRKLGLTKKQIEKGIAALEGVEGRMNIIDEGQKFKVIVDFASTPDGFEKFFESVRPLTKGKLIAVFGSAGRRDESKRPIQGRIAGKYADIVIATEEDDRDIDGNQILKEIAAGAKKAGKKEGKDLFLILNREEAIGFAMTQAASLDDVVVLLGKGHEMTIERADGTYPWNEAEVARAALQAMKKNR